MNEREKVAARIRMAVSAVYEAGATQNPSVADEMEAELLTLIQRPEEPVAIVMSDTFGLKHGTDNLYQVVEVDEPLDRGPNST